MIGLFFEVEPNPGHEDRYFDTAAKLRPALDENGGVLFIDRYKSLDRPERILSYQHWSDEAHLVKWRENTQHQGAQRAGRTVHFADYRIRVAQQITPDTALTDQPSNLVVVVESTNRVNSREGGEIFDSVYRDAQFVTLYDVAVHDRALEIMDAYENTAGVTAIHVFTVLRDYAMKDRAEAPQSW